MESVVQGMKISDDKSKFDCETCVMAKQPNVRNRTPDVRAKEPFELLTFLAPLIRLPKMDLNMLLYLPMTIPVICLPNSSKRSQMQHVSPRRDF